VKKILIAVLAFVCVASICYAADQKAPAANEPVGAAVEATGTFVGKVVSVVTEGSGGATGPAITVADETGKMITYPVDPTVKIVDAAVNAVTLNQLKKGDKVAVEYSKDQTGSEKAKAINVVQ
jgi:hypothetical protein